MICQNADLAKMYIMHVIGDSLQSTLCPPKLVLWNVINNHKVVTAFDTRARSCLVV